MKKIICLFLVILLGIATVRTLSGLEPLPMTSFLKSVSRLDLSFTDTMEQLQEVRDALVFPSLGSGSDIFETVGIFFNWLYSLLVAIISVPIDLVGDALDFILSIFEFFKVLVS